MRSRIEIALLTVSAASWFALLVIPCCRRRRRRRRRPDPRSLLELLGRS